MATCGPQVANPWCQGIGKDEEGGNWKNLLSGHKKIPNFIFRDFVPKPVCRSSKLLAEKSQQKSKGETIVAAGAAVLHNS
jgi:hypothetical protein